MPYVYHESHVFALILGEQEAAFQGQCTHNHLNYFNIGNDIIKTCYPNCRNRIEIACIIKYAHLVRVKCIQNICLQTD